MRIRLQHLGYRVRWRRTNCLRCLQLRNGRGVKEGRRGFKFHRVAPPLLVSGWALGRRNMPRSLPAPFHQHSDEDLQEHVTELLEAEPEEAMAADLGPSEQPKPPVVQASQAQEVVKQAGERRACFIELGDRFTYEVATDPPQRHTVQIVDSPSNLRLGLLNDSTPVAQALLGLCEGDEAELRVKDQPVRMLRILHIERRSANIADD